MSYGSPREANIRPNPCKQGNQSFATVGTCSPGQVDPTGVCSNVNSVFARDGNSFVNLASQGHCAGVFIGI
jgi:hypothetical protein